MGGRAVLLPSEWAEDEDEEEEEEEEEKRARLTVLLLVLEWRRPCTSAASGTN